MYLRWGLRWGLLWGMIAGSGKVVSDAPPAVAVGSSSMTITRTLALFPALWARVLKRDGFGVKQIRYKAKQQRLKNYKNSKKVLLFFFLVGAERGEIEVRLTSGAARRRSRFPCPLGRSSSGGPGRPHSSCRSGMRRSRGNSACRGRACRTARRLLTRLPPRYVPGLAETPSWWSWGLRLRRAG